jgi:hypothetical protein
MEQKNFNKSHNSTIPSFFKTNKMKLGKEENEKLFSLNQNNNNDSKDIVENTTEKVKFLFPDLSTKDVKNVLERAEYNIEKTIELLKELKKEQKKKSENNNNSNTSRFGKKVKKRNYLEFIQKIKDKTENKNEINNNVNDNINSNVHSTNIQNKNQENKEINQIKQTQSNDESNEKDSNNNNIENNSIINNLDEEKKNLINSQIDYLLNKFSKMNNISELKKLLTEIGFPLEKEEQDKDNINIIELQKKLDEKVNTNSDIKNKIVSLYKKYEKTCVDIKQKQDKIEELSNTLGNLIDTETDQKIRKERLEKELKDSENSIFNNNNFNGPKEGY